MAQTVRDASRIERRLLDLAHTTDARITAAALAYFAPCSIDEAAAVLDDLAARDRLTMEIEDDGTIVYELRGRQRLGAAPVPPPPMAMLPYVRPAVSPVLAMLLTVLVPGGGHLYAGYVLLVPGLVLHLFSIASAGRTARRQNAAAAQPMLLAA